jgi:protein-tyrosine phosphatase
MDVSQILPNLFVGSYPRTTGDIARLKREFGVTAVLNLQTDGDLAELDLDWDVMAAEYAQQGMDVRRVPVRDFDGDDLRRKLPQCVAALHELLELGRTVFVHCNMGINRSPSAVVAYLYWSQGWDLDKAIDHVTRCRSCDPYVDVIRLASTDRVEAKRRHPLR